MLSLPPLWRIDCSTSEILTGFSKLVVTRSNVLRAQRLLELHQVEEQLTGLCAVEPYGTFLENVMSRITQPEPHLLQSAQRFSPEALKKPMIVLGGLILAAAYVVPSAGESWLASLWPSAGLFRAAHLSAYLAAHPPWAVILAAVAALLVVFGLALPEGQGVKNAARKSMIQ